MPNTSVWDLSTLAVQVSFSAPVQQGCTLLQVSIQISNLYMKIYVKSVVSSLISFWVTRTGPVWEKRRRWVALEPFGSCLSWARRWVRSVYRCVALEEGENAEQKSLTLNKLEIQQQKKMLNLLHVSSKTTFRSYLSMFHPIFSNNCSKVKLKSASTPETSLGNGTALT